jgi:hypothetical protein
MKKLIIGCLLAGLFLIAKSPLMAGDFTASITTYPVTEAATMAVQITGAQEIDKLVITNATNTVTQVVTVYKLCASTTTITAVATFAVSNTAPLILDYTENYNNPLSLTSGCFRKSDTTDAVYISAHYR